MDWKPAFRQQQRRIASRAAGATWSERQRHRALWRALAAAAERAGLPDPRATALIEEVALWKLTADRLEAKVHGHGAMTQALEKGGGQDLAALVGALAQARERFLGAVEAFTAACRGAAGEGGVAAEEAPRAGSAPAPHGVPAEGHGLAPVGGEAAEAKAGATPAGKPGEEGGQAGPAVKGEGSGAPTARGACLSPNPSMQKPVRPPARPQGPPRPQPPQVSSRPQAPQSPPRPSHPVRPAPGPGAATPAQRDTPDSGGRAASGLTRADILREAAAEVLNAHG